MEFSLAPFWGGPFSHLEILITAGWSRAFIEAAGRAPWTSMVPSGCWTLDLLLAALRRKEECSPAAVGAEPEGRSTRGPCLIEGVFRVEEFCDSVECRSRFVRCIIADNEIQLHRQPLIE